MRSVSSRTCLTSRAARARVAEDRRTLRPTMPPSIPTAMNRPAASGQAGSRITSSATDCHGEVEAPFASQGSDRYDTATPTAARTPPRVVKPMPA